MAPRISDQAMAAVVPQGIEREIKPAQIVDGQLTSVGGNESEEGISEAGKKAIEGLARGVPAREIITKDCGNATPLQGGASSQPTRANQTVVNMDAGPATPIVVPMKRESSVLTEVLEAGERVPKWQPKAASGAQKISRFKTNRIAQRE